MSVLDGGTSWCSGSELTAAGALNLDDGQCYQELRHVSSRDNPEAGRVVLHNGQNREAGPDAEKGHPGAVRSAEPGGFWPAVQVLPQQTIPVGGVGTNRLCGASAQCSPHGHPVDAGDGGGRRGGNLLPRPAAGVK